MSAERIRNNLTRFQIMMVLADTKNRRERNSTLFIKYSSILEQSRTLHRAKQYGQELDVLLKGVVIDPLNTTLLLRIGRAYRCLGDTDRAVAYYNEAIKIYPGNPVCYQNIGVAYAAAERYMDARPFFEEAFKKMKQNPEKISQNDIARLYGNYARCIGHLGNLHKAKKN